MPPLSGAGAAVLPFPFLLRFDHGGELLGQDVTVSCVILETLQQKWKFPSAEYTMVLDGDTPQF